MAQVPVTWGPLTWDTARGVITVTCYAQDAPQPPNDGRYWMPPTGSILTFEVPAKKATTTAPTVVLLEPSPTGMVRTRYTWNGTAYADPVRINDDGSPWTG